jgi:outer membrane lipoprotein-sorting protein
VIWNILILFVLSGSADVELLNEISLRYSSAEGIQWEIESIVYSEIFEENDTTSIEFDFFPPDTFSISSELEKIAGIGDTVWVMSKRHKQIQKKATDGSVMPYNFILNWEDNYSITEHRINGKYSMFRLESLGSVLPEKLLLISDEKNRIRKVQYFDSKGDQVTMLFRKEKLKRPLKFENFYEEIPEGYDYIDLTE